MKILTCGVLVLGLALGLGACGDSDGDGDGGVGPAVSFTADNAAQMAAYFVGAESLFPPLSRATLAVLDAVATAGSGGTARATAARDVIDLGAIDICSSGSDAHGSWDDRDGGRTFSPGDVLTLSLEGCDGVSGTVTMDFSATDVALTAAIVVVDLSSTETLDGELETTDIQGRCELVLDRIPGPPERAIFRYLVGERTDGSQRLSTSLNGRTMMELGCFNLYFDFNLDANTFEMSQPQAVFKLASGRIMSLECWEQGFPGLSFANDVPYGGAIKFYAESSSTPCSALGVPGDGIDANGSFLTLTATGGGNLTLAGETAGGTPFSLSTTWDDVY